MKMNVASTSVLIAFTLFSGVEIFHSTNILVCGQMNIRQQNATTSPADNESHPQQTLTLPTVNILRVSTIVENDAGVQAALQVFRQAPLWNNRFQINMVTRLTNRTATQEIGVTLRIVVRALARSNVTYGAMIGPDANVEAAPICQITPVYNLVNVASGIVLDSFSELSDYPLFFRTSVQTRYMIQAIQTAVSALDISRLSTITVRDAVSSDRIHSFEDGFIKLNGTLERSANVDAAGGFGEEASRLVARGTDYVVAAMNDQFIYMVCEVYKRSPPGASPVWFSFDLSDIRGTWHPQVGDPRMNCTLDEIRIALNGSVFALQKNINYNIDDDDIVDYHPSSIQKAYDNVQTNMTAAAIFALVQDWITRLNISTTSYNLGALTTVPITQTVFAQYDATWALLTAIYRTDQRLEAAGKQRIHEITDSQSPAYEEYADLLTEEMLATNFVGATGLVQFNPKHDRVGDIQIRQYQALLAGPDAKNNSTTSAYNRFALIGTLTGGNQSSTSDLNTGAMIFRTPTGQLPHAYKRNQQLLAQANQLSTTAIVLICVAAVAVFVLVVALLMRFYMRALQRAHLQDISWILSANLLKITRHGKSTATSAGSMLSSLSSRLDVTSQMSTTTHRSMATYGDGLRIHLRVLPATARHKLVKGMRPESLNAAFPAAIEMKRLANDNVVRFVGVCLDAEVGGEYAGSGAQQVAAFEYQIKGPLRELLHNESIKVEWDWKYSFMSDVVKGVQVLHDAGIVHGFLHTDNVVLDSKFTAKVCDYGLADVARNEFDLQAVKAKLVDEMTEKELAKVLFRSPEQTRLGFFGHSLDVKQSDIFSLGMVLIEIATRELPKFVTGIDDGNVLPTAAVIKAKATQTDHLNGGLIPQLTDADLGIQPSLRTLLRSCTLHQPQERPVAAQPIYKALSRVPGFTSGSVVENLVKRLQSYAHDLELVVDERTKALEEEMRRSEQLLLQILPRAVAEELKAGRPVPPETYACASIYFSDIVGFTHLSAHSTPLQVVELLNALYTTFDSVLETRRVYKVETIGDAYMVASGLPERIGDEHALEICMFSLQVIKAINAFRIPHDPSRGLQLRIGLHCGSCVAGVVGVKMPRYCLFGDTVNTASRMESTGEPMKIHTSGVLHELVTRVFPDSFMWAERGEIDIKGLGKRLTYWLTDYDSNRVFM